MKELDELESSSHHLASDQGFQLNSLFFHRPDGESRNTNAALGFINIEQNRLLKIFSIAALVFLPPTLIAGIYGMNFEHMPELAWPWGYPLAQGLILTAAVVPILLVKRKGWL